MPDYRLWVGGYTKAPDEGIGTMALSAGGKLTLLSVTPEVSPSFLARSGDTIYTARESRDIQKGVGAFSIHGDHLHPLAEVDVGAGPCHVYARDDRIYAACYGGGILAAIKRKGDTLTCDRIVRYADSDFANERKPRSHFVCTTPDEGYVSLVDLGLDSVIFHKLDADGCFPEKPSFVQALPQGFGPRHMTYSPCGKYAYVCGEYANEVMVYAYADGKLEQLQCKSTLPDDGFEDKTYCGTIHITRDGKFLLISNRGHNTIAVFPVGYDGLLGGLTCYDCGGDFPRDFTLSPDEKFVVCADQKSGTLDVSTFDAQTGAMKFASSLSYITPTAVLFG